VPTAQFKFLPKLEGTSQIPNVSSHCTDCIHKRAVKARSVQRKRNVKKVFFLLRFSFAFQKKNERQIEI